MTAFLYQIRARAWIWVGGFGRPATTDPFDSGTRQIVRPGHFRTSPRRPVSLARSLTTQSTTHAAVSSRPSLPLSLELCMLNGRPLFGRPPPRGQAAWTLVAGPGWTLGGIDGFRAAPSIPMRDRPSSTSERVGREAKGAGRKGEVTPPWVKAGRYLRLAGDRPSTGSVFASSRGPTGERRVLSVTPSGKLEKKSTTNVGLRHHRAPMSQ